MRDRPLASLEEVWEELPPPKAPWQRAEPLDGTALGSKYPTCPGLFPSRLLDAVSEKLLADSALESIFLELNHPIVTQGQDSR